MSFGSIATNRRRSDAADPRPTVPRAWVRWCGACLVAGGMASPADAQWPWRLFQAAPPACDTIPGCDVPGIAPGRLPHPARPDAWAQPVMPRGGPDQPTRPPSEPSRGRTSPPRDGQEPDIASPSDQAAADAAADDLGAADDLSMAALSLSGALADAGAGRGSFSAAPNMTGDFFGAGVSQITGKVQVPFSAVLPGFILNDVSNGSPDALLGFGNVDVTPPPFGLESTGLGMASQAEGPIDTFALAEPMVPNLYPTAPGPGFVFDGGTAIWLGPKSIGSPNFDGQFESDIGQVPVPPGFADGDDWQVDYSYSSHLTEDGRPIFLAGPDVATRRVKLSENFSPEVRDRCFMNYNYFNNAMGGLGDVNRWVLGIERILYEDMISLELRQPMAGTRSGRQDIGAPGDRSYELGNLTAIGKAVLYRNHRWIWTSGLGVTAPLARDSKLMRGNETLLRIENQAVHLLPYSAMLYRHDAVNLFQFYTQLDVDVSGNPIRGNLNGGNLPLLGRYREASLMHVDLSYHRVLNLNRRGGWIKEAIANAELHYTGSLEDSNVVSGNGILVTNLARRFNVVNATFSNHWLLSNHLVVTPGIAVPLRGGNDRQFNLEAILQVNYLR